VGCVGRDYRSSDKKCKVSKQPSVSTLARPIGEAMNPHIIIERRPRDWITTTAVVIGECAVMFLLGYLSRPVIQTWIGG